MMRASLVYYYHLTGYGEGGWLCMTEFDEWDEINILREGSVLKTYFHNFMAG